MDKELKIKISVDKKTGNIKVVGNEFDLLKGKTQKTTDGINSLNSSILNLAKGATAIYALKQAFDFSREIVTTGIAFESLRDSLSAATGGVHQGARALSFLKEETERLGTSFEPSIRGFKDLSAAAEGTTLNTQTIRDIFTGVSEASTVMKLSVDDTNGVFRALSQIMSKGTVQAEELRGQLGERLPGAFVTAAKAMGVTTRELNKMLEQGQVISDEFLPKFADELSRRFGKDVPIAAKSAQASMNKFGNELLNLKVAIADSGVTDLAQDFTDISTEILKATSNFIKGLKVELQSVNEIKEYEEYFTKMASLGAEWSEYEDKKSLWYYPKDAALQKQKMIEGEISLLREKYRWIEDTQEIELNDPKPTKPNSKTNEEIKAQEKLIAANNKAYDSYVQITGSSYDKWLSNTNNTMIDLATNGNLTTKQLMQVWSTLEQGFNESQIDTTWSDTLNKNYTTMLDSQIDLISSTNEWQNGLSGVAESIYGISTSLSKLSVDNLTYTKEQFLLDNKFEAERAKYSDDKIKQAVLTHQYTKDSAALKQKAFQNELQGYAQLTGAMSGMFEQGSREAAAFEMAQSGLALVAGVTAIVSQGAGDPYTAFARIAAMSALVVSTLQSAGIAFGGAGTTTTSYDTFSAETANVGAGTTLGDTTAQSESVVNSLSLLEELAQPEFELISQMTKSLLSIEQNIGGLTGNIIKQGGFALGEGFTPSSSLSFFEKNMDLIIGTALPKSLDLFVDPVTSWIGSALGGVLGGSSSSSLSDSGLSFNEQLITDAINNISGNSYQTIKTDTDGGWFSSDSTSYNSYFEMLEYETSSQFELVLSNLYETVLLSSDALDITLLKTTRELSDFYVDLGKISLKGKTGEEIQEELTNIFGAVADEMAYDAFPLLSNFQHVGEGLFETLSRVSVGMEEAEYYINRLGYAFDDVTYTQISNKQGDIALEALQQSIVKFDEAIYGLDNGVVKMVENINGSVADLYESYETFTKLRSQLAMIGKDESYLTSNMLLGAGGVNELSSGMDSYFENYLSDDEQLKYNTQSMRAEFDKLNLTIPHTKEDFSNLVESLNISSASGQELYGRLILLSDSFSSLQDEAAVWDESIKSAIEAYDDSYTNSLDEINSELNSFVSSLKGVTKTLDVTLSKITGTRDDLALTNQSATDQEFYLLSRYNQELSEFNAAQTSYFENPYDVEAANNYTTNRDELLSVIDSYRTVVDENGLSNAGVDAMDLTLSNIYDATTIEQNLMAQQLKELEDIQANTFAQNEQLLAVNTNIAEQLRLQLAEITAAKDAITPAEFMYDTTLSGRATADGFIFDDGADFKLTMADGAIIQREYSTLDEAIVGLKDIIEQYPTEFLYEQASSAIDYYTMAKDALAPYEGEYTNLDSMQYYEALAYLRDEQVDVATYMNLSARLISEAFNANGQSYYTGNYTDPNGLSTYSPWTPSYHMDEYFKTATNQDLLNSGLNAGFDNEMGITIDQNWLRLMGSAINLPSYDVGTSFVPHDQIAKIHQGEAILPLDHAKVYRERGLNIGNDLNGIILVVGELQKLNSKIENLEEQNATLVEITHTYTSAEARKDREVRAKELIA
ncbi:MAG: tape measure protein [Helicobacteraceae bacterium]|nr:tape measure protein [Helicobacteraceae bacterium]